MGDNQSVALYRKYRGLSFGDIVGQEHITGVLENAIKKNKISHAYLFTGPRGVGKTSVARIFAHAINGLDYKHEDNHIDIIEIDAASNRRIDEIRDLRQKAHVAPVSAKYKVYIIDEVHMLTKEAFNALLKTLEEPPSHIVFILATTEAHKLPQTIISRTQRHTFKPIPVEVASNYLATIAKSEGLSVDGDALDQIARYGDGSFRDSISLLDQVSGIDEKQITLKHVQATLGLADSSDIEKLMQAIENSDASAVSQSLNGFLAAGTQPELIAKQLINYIQQSTTYLTNLDLVEQLIEVAPSSQPMIKLELTLLRAAGAEHAQTVSQPMQVAPPSPAPTPAPEPEMQNEDPKPQPEAIEEESVEAEEEPTPALEPKKDLTSFDSAAWKNIIDKVKTENNAIASILRNAKPEVDGEVLVIGVKFGFHKKKLEAGEIATLVSDAIIAALGGPRTVEIVVNEKIETAASAIEIPDRESDEVAERIISTFGGGEKVNI